VDDGKGDGARIRRGKNISRSAGKQDGRENLYRGILDSRGSETAELVFVRGRLTRFTVDYGNVPSVPGASGASFGVDVLGF
jgi:hypothetical protein